MFAYTLGAKCLYDREDPRVTQKARGGSVYTSLLALARVYSQTGGLCSLEDNTTARMGIYVVSLEPEDLGEELEPGHFHVIQDVPILARVEPAYPSVLSDPWDQVVLSLTYYCILQDLSLLQGSLVAKSHGRDEPPDGIEDLIP